MIAFFEAHIAQMFVVIGLALLALEIAILGFSTFVFFFVGAATLLTGGLMYLGILEENLLQGIAGVAVLSSVLAALLWKPLKAMQKEVVKTSVQQDFIGEQFRLSAAIGPDQDGSEKYSGIHWVVRSNSHIDAHALVRIKAVSVGVLEVEPCE
ncbi:NfeD family protein [Aliiglaciecola sp. CAU 1673]|uniref:NfeD family protein n=1 Tax=Aliiglaciecola sp. CAU 1673 TaxID=3032595 RepID=UPI0023DA264C|nr:NfeD family protein [Aliiglaciecola sp. CAU 1673]MDF2180264.1 NfeD family protein [Aliiglaciecola sp. CAU 1673]